MVKNFCKNMNFKRVKAFALTLFVFLSQLQIALTQEINSKKHIAILLNNNIGAMHISAQIMKEGLERAGHRVSLYFAGDREDLQIAQVEALVFQSVDLLIISAVDGKALSNSVEIAKRGNVKVIAYDRFIENVNIDCYIAFDAFRIGALEGRIIERSLGLHIQQKGPFYMEIFSSPSNKFESELYYRGAINVLQPYLDKRRLIVLSEQFSFRDTSLKDADSHQAQIRMSNLIDKYYVNNKLDVVLCSEDIFALGVIKALKDNKYKVGNDKKIKSFPIITGQNCDKKNIKAIINREQTASVFKDYRILARETVDIADDLLNRRALKYQNIIHYKYKGRSILACLHEPTLLYKDDIQEVIFDSMYYRKSDILKIANK
jgi:putative multiple sugar transport system substrate-binding protein